LPVDLELLARDENSTQEPVSASEVLAICRRVLGEAVGVRSAVEMGLGSYNTTLRLEVDDGRAMVLRMAPRPDRQQRSERRWMRSEYAAAPWLIGLGPLVPCVLGADFTHHVIGRDCLIQTLLPGVPAPHALAGYDRAQWPTFFAQLGAINRRINDVTGDSWGPLHGPVDRRWSDAIERSLRHSATDLAARSLPVADVVKLVEVVDRFRHRLDGIGPPRLLHGDLWTVNALLDGDAAQPTVVGVVDAERSWWGDPLADWALYRAEARPLPAERNAFWSGYGERDLGSEVAWRSLLYQGRHLVADRVEAARRNDLDRVERTVVDLADVLATLG
jgi:aminoglycoside phosphotransferase (APT) family kinase protein